MFELCGVDVVELEETSELVAEWIATATAFAGDVFCEIIVRPFVVTGGFEFADFFKVGKGVLAHMELAGVLPDGFLVDEDLLGGEAAIDGASEAAGANRVGGLKVKGCAVIPDDEVLRGCMGHTLGHGRCLIAILLQYGSDDFCHFSSPGSVRVNLVWEVLRKCFEWGVEVNDGGSGFFGDKVDAGNDFVTDNGVLDAPLFWEDGNWIADPDDGLGGKLAKATDEAFVVGDEASAAMPVFRFGIIGAQLDDHHIRIEVLCLLELGTLDVGCVSTVEQRVATVAEVFHLEVVTEEFLQLSWVTVFGGVFDAGSLGDAVSNAGDLDFSGSCLGVAGRRKAEAQQTGQ